MGIHGLGAIWFSILWSSMDWEGMKLGTESIGYIETLALTVLMRIMIT